MHGHVRARTFRPAFALTDLLAPFARAEAAWRERRALERLDDRGLADIGLTRGEVLGETLKGMWDLPAPRRR